MSDLYKKASLVMLPQAVDTSKVYSIKPENRDGDFTFTRSSYATRVNADGNIEKETQNLLLQSNTFDTTWALVTASVTSGQSGYDGSSNAWLLSKSASSARVQQSISTSGVQTFSVYAKAGTLNYVMLNNAYVSQWFDLSNGTTGTNSSSSNTIDANIESVGNGWYRCSLIFNTSISIVRIYPSQADNDVSGTSGNIYIQDAQLEQGLVARDYIETTTAAVEGGITDNVPRLDYTDSSCPALLLEPQRSNLIPHSEYIQGIMTNVSYDYNDETSPENVQNAATLKLAADSSAVRHRQLFSLSATDGTDYTFSVFFKEADANWIQLMGAAASSVFSTGVWANFDLDNGVVGNKGADLVDSGIEDYGNGWYRCYITAEAEATATGYFEILTTNNANSNRYPSYQNTTALDYVHLYGLQIEAGSYATSYIPSYGSSVTRVGENSNKTGISNLIGQSEGTLFLNYTYGHSQVNAELFSLSDGSVANRIYVGEIGNTFVALVRKDSVNQFNPSGLTPVIGQQYKIAIAYANNDFAFYINGTQIAVDNNGLVPATSQIRTDSGAGSSKFYHDINQVLVFPTRLSNEELADLTTL